MYPKAFPVKFHRTEHIKSPQIQQKCRQNPFIDTCIAALHLSRSTIVGVDKGYKQASSGGGPPKYKANPSQVTEITLD